MKAAAHSYPEHYELGYVVKTHGVRGDMVIFLDSDDPARYRKMKSLFLELEGALKEFSVKKTSVVEKHAIVHLEGIEDMTTAEQYLKKRIFMPLSFLPKLQGKQFYFHEIIGFEVEDAQEGKLGKLTEVYDLTQHPVAEVAWQDKKIMFPLIPDFIEKIDRENSVLYMHLPEGMLDVYR